VLRAVREWRKEAKKAGLSRAEQDSMAGAFELAERATA
jgi:hypothetical protein